MNAARLASAADELIQLISELKTAMIVQDIGESSQDERSTNNALVQDTLRANQDLMHLRESLSGTLNALERHYYASVPFVRAAVAEAKASQK